MSEKPTPMINALLQGTLTIPEPYRLNGGTGPTGLKLADWEKPVFDGPDPRKPYIPNAPKPSIPNDMKLNTEGDE